MVVKHLLPIALLLFLSVSAHADCQRDQSGVFICGAGMCQRTSKGYVFCTAYKDGVAVKSRSGEILCAKGRCLKTRMGEFVCSAVPGGDVFKDYKGNISCQGQCELASANMCVRQPAQPWAGRN